jgi:hypothetical protein
MSDFGMMRYCPYCGEKWEPIKLRGQIAIGRIVCGLCGCEWHDFRRAPNSLLPLIKKLRDALSQYHRAGHVQEKSPIWQDAVDVLARVDEAIKREEAVNKAALAASAPGEKETL